MKKRDIITLIVVIVVAIGALAYIHLSYDKDADNTSVTRPESERKIVLISLEVQAPFSTATLSVTPISTSAQVTTDGTLTYVDRNTTETESVTEEEYKELADLIKANDFWSFNEEYIDNSIMDGTYETVTVTSIPSDADPTLVDAEVYSVMCYVTCPDEITEIIQMIKDLWGKDILEIGV